MRNQYLVALTIVAGYALHRANALSLPIPNIQSAMTVALPPLAGIALEAIFSFKTSLAAKGKLQHSKVFQAVNAAFLVYGTVLATLAGTHIVPLGGLWCRLHDRWNELFRNKNEKVIRGIQDALNCCGFASTKDIAWPFPDHAHKSDACVVRYERDRSCLEPWRAAERKVAIMLLVVPVCVFAWKLALFLAPGFETSWLPSTIRLPTDHGESARDRPRAAITYRDLEEQGDEDSLREEVNQLNKDSNLATHVENGRRQGRVRPSPLIEEQENGWTRD